MSEQTTFSTANRDESDSRTADEATSDRSAHRSSTDDAQIDILHSETIDQWVTEREDANEPYGYFHLYVAAQSDLSGVQRALCWETRIEHATDDAGEPSPRFGTGGIRAVNARDRFLEWKLGLLAVPLHPELRTIPAENLRVFVADTAREYLAEESIEIGGAVEQVNTIDEHTPTEEQLARRREYAMMQRLTGVSGPLDGRIRAIEDTLRARFEFTSRYGYDVPDPDPVYAEKSLDTLEAMLERARCDHAEAESQCEELRDQIRSAEAQWIEETRATLRE
ncbi:hypothetical protein [Saliphagus infecundisoli]|uniref:Uncharacterized protein n=1 Tax=Saliphagus infecundisoli TaxID=1849069 RepID=A0ABD5QHH0_9EURY|nr:hypothetical protein [Saliphagus infecundisoli]